MTMALPLNDPPLRRLAWRLFAAGLLLRCVLSASALARFGIPYDAPFGPLVAKIHPGTYLLVAAYAAALASHGNPLQVLASQWQRHRLLAAYLAGMLIVFVWTIFRHGTSGVAFIVETLWTPAIAAFTLLLLPADRHRRTVVMVIVFLGVNSVLAIAESMVGARLVPFQIAGDTVVEEDYFRASALLGHPLHNAMITVSLLPAVGLLPWRWSARAALATVLLVSLLAFGGRTSFFLGVGVYGICGLAVLLANTVRGRYSYLQLTGGSVLLMLGSAVLAAFAAATGLGERIFKSLVWDNSASVRTRVWNAFDFMSPTELWIGVPPAQIDAVAHRLGLDLRFEAIENFWIYLLMQFGVIGFVPFVLGLGCLIVYLLKIANPAMRIALLLYLLVASTGNTLAAKSGSLLLLTAVVVGGLSQRRRLQPPQPLQPPRRTRLGWMAPAVNAAHRTLP